MQQQKKSVRKGEIPPWPPGMKESVQKCTKKKRYSLKGDSTQIPLHSKTIWKSGLYKFSHAS